MGMDTIKLTLDTNCIINALCQHTTTPIYVEELEGILELYDDSKIKIRVDLAITTAVEQDLDSDTHQVRKMALMDRLEEFDVLGVLKSEQLKGAQDEIQRILFSGRKSLKKNDLLDIRHLAIHQYHGRDIFVTIDDNFIKKAQKLEEAGIKIQNPASCLSFIKQLIYRDRLVKFVQVENQYQQKAFKGQAAFNYSNNNGKFTIGCGIFAFETKWSKASDRSIYCCSDSPSIASLAIATRKEQISDIVSAKEYDFSSRCRTTHFEAGKSLLVLQNQNGIYAAIHVICIKDDTRSDGEDWLEFEYVIQTNGSDNFSSL